MRLPEAIVEKKFWDYLEKWRGLFPRRRTLRWRDGWIQNGYCCDCRYCCGPQDSNEPYPMALLPRQIHAGIEKDFYMLNADTAYMDGRGCKSCSPTGCGLPRENRPVACGLFPFALINGSLYAYKTCPAILFTPLAQLAPLGREAARWLTGFSHDELRHLSLNVEPAVLAEKYISLGIQVFDDNGVNLRLR